MRAFLCSIDDSVWDAIEIGWTRPEEVNVGKSGFVSHTKHTVEVTITDLLHS